MNKINREEWVVEQMMKQGMPKHCGVCGNKNLCNQIEPEKVCHWLKLRKAWKLRYKFLSFVLVIFSFAGTLFAQSETEALLPPPVEISFTLQNTSIPGGLVVIKFSARATEDVHVDISCLLPEGVEVVDGGLLNLRSCHEIRNSEVRGPIIYRDEIAFYTGLVSAGATKDFYFTVRITQEGEYALIGRAQALAQWGIKEQVFKIDLR